MAASNLHPQDACSAGQEAKVQQKDGYEIAITILNTMQTVTTARETLGSRLEAKTDKVRRIINFLQRVDLSLDDIDNLSVIHVAGTKGKGSTCAYAESILRHHGVKTGFYSSPHMVEARERIRINGRPITKDLFTFYFWDVYIKLLNTKEDNEGTMPLYFSFLTVMAFTLFVKEKVDVVLLEVGIGGEYDYTNFVRTPVACGICSLGLDHTTQLGHTLEEIAWHKAGIFKRGVPAVTIQQEESAMNIILQRAQEIQCPLYVAEPLTEEDLRIHSLTLGISGDKQVYNAGLALHLCRLWLRRRGNGDGTLGPENDEPHVCLNTVKTIPRLHTGELTQEIKTGLSRCYWPGRAQTLKKAGVTYYLDGAHTIESMQQCVRWFIRAADEEARHIKGRVSRSLIFNMTGERSATSMLHHLVPCGFHVAAFCPNIPSTKKVIADQVSFKHPKTTILEKSVSYRQDWDDLVSKAEEGPNCQSANFPCISTALKWATHDREPFCCDVTATVQVETGDLDHVQVLVTGSLILVGDVLGIIYPTLND